MQRRRSSSTGGPIGCAVGVALIVAAVAVVGGGLAGIAFYERTKNTAGQPTPHAPATVSTSPSAAPRRQLTILGAGDIIVHPAVWQQAQADKGGTGYDFFPIFEGVSETISGADLALCHLDSPVSAAAATPSGFPVFNAPPEIVDGLKKAGFDGCSTASNHSLDQGLAGVTRTVEAMTRAGLKSTGTFGTAEAAAMATPYQVKGVQVMHLSYTYTFAVKPPAGKEWMGNLIDPAAIKADAHKAKELSKADIVVVSLHWGTEYQHLPNPEQDALAKDLLASPDIDLLFGHHSHSVQAMERIGGKWAVYGMGNEAARHSENYSASYESFMARMTFTEQSPGKFTVTKAEAIPTWTQQSPKFRVIELPKILAGQSLSTTTRKTYQATLDRIAGYLRLRGGDAAGLVVAGATSGSTGAGSTPSPSPRQ